MADTERSAESSLSLDERLLVWIDRVDKHPRSSESKDKQRTEDLLIQGYQLFFEIIEPFKETKWIQAEHPDLHYQTWFDSRLDERVREFGKLFGWLNDSWGIEIYGYGDSMWFTDSVEASVRLSCGQQGTHGEKMIRVLYAPPSDRGFSWSQGQMYVEDTTASWVRPRSNGEVGTEKEKNLYNYPGLSICKLAVVLADSFAKDQANKLQAQLAQTA